MFNHITSIFQIDLVTIYQLRLLKKPQLLLVIQNQEWTIFSELLQSIKLAKVVNLMLKPKLIYHLKNQFQFRISQSQHKLMLLILLSQMPEILMIIIQYSNTISFTGNLIHLMKNFRQFLQLDQRRFSRLLISQKVEINIISEFQPKTKQENLSLLKALV